MKGYLKSAAPIAALVTSFFHATMVHAQAPGGHSNCPCIGLPPTIPAHDCEEDFAAEGKCIRVPDLAGQPLYPADYGATCKKHLEPGASPCYNLAAGLELPAGERASWCDQPFCFVDPRHCMSHDLEPSTYFLGNVSYACEVESPCAVMYSYEACGSVDLYTDSDTKSYLRNKKEYGVQVISQFMNAPGLLTSESRGAMERPPWPLLHGIS